MPTPRKSRKTTTTREVIYPEEKLIKARGEHALTADKAMSYLGWQVLAEKGGSGLKPTLIDKNKDKVVFTNNINNRPFDYLHADKIAYTVLNRRWKFNWQPVIIGRTAITVDGQHRLAGCALAKQIWLSNRGKWEHLWPTEPVMETLIVEGAEEDPAMVMTIDNNRSRTLADVIYVSGMFPKADEKQRRLLANYLDWAVRLLWYRTGQGDLRPGKYRTISESISFIDSHQRIIECVKHLSEENLKNVSKDAVSRYLTIGYASCMMFLMASSQSDMDTYRLADMPSEEHLDFDMFDKASEFWSSLAQRKEDTRSVRAVLDDEPVRGWTKPEQLAIVAKAWLAYSQGSVTEEDLELHYETNEEGEQYLDECPTVGGIDLGNPKDNDTADKVVVAPAPVVKAAARMTKEQRTEKVEKLIANRKTKKEN